MFQGFENRAVHAAECREGNGERWQRSGMRSSSLQASFQSLTLFLVSVSGSGGGR